MAGKTGIARNQMRSGEADVKDAKYDEVRRSRLGQGLRHGNEERPEVAQKGKSQRGRELRETEESQVTFVEEIAQYLYKNAPCEIDERDCWTIVRIVAGRMREAPKSVYWAGALYALTDKDLEIWSVMIDEMLRE